MCNILQSNYVEATVGDVVIQSLRVFSSCPDVSSIGNPWRPGRFVYSVLLCDEVHTLLALLTLGGE